MRSRRASSTDQLLHSEANYMIERNASETATSRATYTQPYRQSEQAGHQWAGQATSGQRASHRQSATHIVRAYSTCRRHAEAVKDLVMISISGASMSNQQRIQAHIGGIINELENIWDACEIFFGPHEGTKERHDKMDLVRVRQNGTNEWTFLQYGRRDHFPV